MFASTVLEIGLAERPWGAEGLSRNQRFGCFLGKFMLHPESGLYFADGCDDNTRHMIGGCFLQLPGQLRAVALQHQLTISTSAGCTLAGNSSTFYCNFKRQPLSPHIELGQRSLSSRLLLPHLAHEVSHLWWGLLDETTRNRYAAFLEKTYAPGTAVEVTPYVHDLYLDWCRSLNLPNELPYAANHRQSYLRDWARESFCDTVAALVEPDYPRASRQVEHLNGHPHSTIDLEERRLKIHAFTGLQIRVREPGHMFVQEKSEETTQASQSSNPQI